MPTLYHAPRATRHATRSAPRLGAVHDALLHALLIYIYLTSELACRLLYQPGSLTYVRAAFKTLEDAHLVSRLYLGRQTPGGSSKKVFTLTARGLAYLQRAGYETWPRYHAQEQVDVGTLHLRHHLGTASTLIAIALACQRLPALRLERLLAERALRRAFRASVTIHNQTGAARKRTVWPDGYVEFRAGDRLMPVVLEYDRGTESRRAWQDKVAGLVAYADGPFQAAAGRQSLTIAVLTPHSDKRRNDLVAWTAAVLQAERDAETKADLFRFAAADPDCIAPTALLLAPMWYRPLAATPTALVAAMLEPVP